MSSILRRVRFQSGLGPERGPARQIFETTAWLSEQEPVEGPSSSSRRLLVVRCASLGALPDLPASVRMQKDELWLPTNSGDPREAEARRGLN